MRSGFETQKNAYPCIFIKKREAFKKEIQTPPLAKVMEQYSGIWQNFDSAKAASPHDSRYSNLHSIANGGRKFNP